MMRELLLLSYNRNLPHIYFPRPGVYLENGPFFSLLFFFRVLNDNIFLCLYSRPLFFVLYILCLLLVNEIRTIDSIQYNRGPCSPYLFFFVWFLLGFLRGSKRRRGFFPPCLIVRSGNTARFQHLDTAHARQNKFTSTENPPSKKKPTRLLIVTLVLHPAVNIIIFIHLLVFHFGCYYIHHDDIEMSSKSL